MEKESTFLVTHADDESAVLKDTADGQVHTLAENPGFEADDAVTATITPEQPLEVAWVVLDIEEQRSLSAEQSEEPPTEQERELAAGEGKLAKQERAGVGELHVLTVPSERVEDTIQDVLDDEATLLRAARLRVNRVEVRTDVEAGVVSVRYLP